MTKSEKIEQVIKMLKFIATIDDLEIIKPTIESAVEALEELNQ